MSTRLAALATAVLSPWRETYVETANGYILCEWHAQAWRDGGNNVSMAPITDEYAAECGGCADCADEAARLTPYADLTVNVFISHPQTLKTVATLQVARDENGLAICDALQEAGWRVTHD